METYVSTSQVFDALANHAPAIIPNNVPVIVQVSRWFPDGFDANPANPTDTVGETFLAAMRDAALELVDKFPTCVLAHQLDSEVNLVLVDPVASRRGISTQRLATSAASVATAAFNRTFRARAMDGLNAIPYDAPAHATLSTAMETIADHVTFSAKAFGISEREIPAYLAHRQYHVAAKLTKRVWSRLGKKDFRDERVYDNVVLMRERIDADYALKWKDLPANVTRGFVARRLESGAIDVDATPPDFDENPVYVLDRVQTTLPTYRTCDLATFNDAMRMDESGTKLTFVPTDKLHILYTKYADVAEERADPSADLHAQAMYKRTAARRDELATELARRGIRV